ncbi:MAG TPA: DUF177 domain-containing protein [Ignavibacteriaceae bacterium]|nr:DUF177 domain-containing protein [Ignavibacteriaceae bacterium]
MFIKISGLGDGVNEFELEEPVEKIGLNAPFFGNFTAKIVLNKAHNQIILNNALKFNVNFDCDRCGKNFDAELETEYEMVYLFGVKREEDESENIKYLVLDADKIQIGNDIKDFAIIALPMKKLCIEDCKGLCYKCGQDLNEGDCLCEKEEVDERWKPLQELKNKLNK